MTERKSVKAKTEGKKPQMTKHYKPIGPSLHLLLPRERRRRRTGGD